jgi:hypothetical protein
MEDVNKTVLIVAGVVLALFLSVPVLAKLKANQGAAPAAETAISGDSAPPAALQPPLLDAASLTGSSWMIKGYTITLGPGGQASVAGTPLGTVTGTWSVSGSTLSAGAMGRNFTAQISGDQIIVDGQPAQRVQ